MGLQRSPTKAGDIAENVIPHRDIVQRPTGEGSLVASAVMWATCLSLLNGGSCKAFVREQCQEAQGRVSKPSISLHPGLTLQLFQVKDEKITRELLGFWSDFEHHLLFHSTAAIDTNDVL